MKTAFKAYKGHVYHVVHETKTGAARKSAWTLCGEYFDAGERSTHQPTCPTCAKLDNPLGLASELREYLSNVVAFGKWKDAPKAKAFHKLRDCDYVDASVRLTRRGEILAEDWTQGAVPMADAQGVIHARDPLRGVARCNHGIAIDGAESMSVSRYQKLRKIEEITVVSCLSCLGK